MFEYVRNVGRLLFGNAPARSSRPSDPPGVVQPRVLLIVHDPIVESASGRRLTEVFGWNNPDALVHAYIADLEQCSGGYLRYHIVERIDANWYPPKRDGFCYTNESFIHAWQNQRIYQPNAIDYHAQLSTFDLIARYERGDFDEVWFVSFPYAGDYESTMVGRNAFWCNAPPIPHTNHCAGRFIIMAFNYERGVDCMLENFGHRVESIMSHVFRHHRPDQHLWNLFTRYDHAAPGQAHCGNVHFAPNSLYDYDWGNRRSVVSCCDAWYRFPDLSGTPRPVNCGEWGNGNMRAHHLWWLDHLPRVAGETFGVGNNWWEYILLLRDDIA